MVVYRDGFYFFSLLFNSFNKFMIWLYEYKIWVE